MVVCVQTFAQEYDVFGYLSALGATFFMALNFVVMRKCKDVHFSVVVLHLSLWSLAVSVAVLLLLKQHHHQQLLSLPHGLHEWGFAVLISVLGLSGQVLVAKALGKEGAGRVAVTRSLDIVLAFILQVSVFGEVPDVLSVSGAVMVLLSVLAMGLEEHIIYWSSLIP
jgi:drug/metabolite transporter (DMT)-like permease